MRLIFVLLSAVGAMLVPAQSSDATWSTIGVVQMVPCGSLEGLAGDRTGQTLATWNDCGASPSDGRVVVATRPSGGAFERTAELPGVVTGMTSQGDGAALVALTDASNRGLKVADVTTAGRIVRTAQLTRRFVSMVDVAADDRGNAIAAWVTSVPPQRLQVRIRTPGHRSFGRVLDLVERGVDVGGLSVAIGPRGTLAVLWASRSDGRRSVFARVRPGAARAFGAPIRAGGNDRRATIDSAFTATGSLVAIWRTTDAGEQQDRPAVLRTATLLNGRRRFTGGRVLGIGVDNEDLRFGQAVRATSAGRGAVVAWTGVGHVVRLAQVTPAGQIGRPVTLDTDALLGDLVATASGAMLVSWGRHLDAGASGRQLVAAVQPPGGRLGTPEVVGPPGTEPAAAAIDTRGTRALVASTSSDSAGSTSTIFEQPIR